MTSLGYPHFKILHSFVVPCFLCLPQLLLQPLHLKKGIKRVEYAGVLLTSDSVETFSRVEALEQVGKQTVGFDFSFFADLTSFDSTISSSSPMVSSVPSWTMSSTFTGRSRVVDCSRACSCVSRECLAALVPGRGPTHAQVKGDFRLRAYPRARGASEVFTHIFDPRSVRCRLPRFLADAS